VAWSISVAVEEQFDEGPSLAGPSLLKARHLQVRHCLRSVTCRLPAPAPIRPNSFFVCWLAPALHSSLAFQTTHTSCHLPLQHKCHPTLRHTTSSLSLSTRDRWKPDLIDPKAISIEPCSHVSSFGPTLVRRPVHSSSPSVGTDASTYNGAPTR
jgi:hypothetical protein